YKAAGSYYRAGAAGATDILFPRWKGFVEAQRNLPRNVAGVCVDGPEPAPWRLLARRISQHASACVSNRSSKHAVRPRYGDAAPVVRLWRSVAAPVVSIRPLLLDPAGESCVVRLKKDVAGLRVGGHAAPVDAAIAREDDGAARRRVFFMEEER